MESAIDLLAAVFLCLSVFAAIKWYSHDAAAFLQFLFTGRRLAIVVSCTVFVGLAYGGYYWYQTLGRVHETHTVDDYRFRITSERDPSWANAGECGEVISISIYHREKLIAKRIHLGSITDDAVAPSFTVRRLPNESLIIVTPNDREDEVVFVFDTANGESYPELAPKDWPEDWSERWPKLYARVGERIATFEPRIRACPGYERHGLRMLWGDR